MEKVGKPIEQVIKYLEDIWCVAIEGWGHSVALTRSNDWHGNVSVQFNAYCWCSTQSVSDFGGICGMISTQA